MPDPLAVAQMLCKEIIYSLIVSYRNRRNKDAQVSYRARRRLLELLRKLKIAQAGFSREVAKATTRSVIDELVKEVIRHVTETSIYIQSAEHWRFHEGKSRWQVWEKPVESVQRSVLCEWRRSSLKASLRKGPAYRRPFCLSGKMVAESLLYPAFAS